MTLLESLAALVILGSTAVGFLEVFHASARATRDAGEWARVTSYAESVMERTKLEVEQVAANAPRGTTAQVETRPWAPGVDEVVVVVTSAPGRRIELRRLTRSHRGRELGPAGPPR
jgi:Tfp pilus assembly protein PilV